MSVTYQAVSWNPAKRTYDLNLGAVCVSYLAVFAGAGSLLFPQATIETLLIRALGTLAFLLLHVILAIGPLCRLHPAFLPLLYNRRHLGVVMFLLALAHGVFSLIQFHALGDVPVLTGLFDNGASVTDPAQFPFQPLGFVALCILFVMAATSHDFWLRQLTAPVWKALHMGVYLAYALLIGHVVFGALQSERHQALMAAVVVGMTAICALHVAAALQGRAQDRESRSLDGFIEVCSIQDIPEKRARITTLAGERVAIFRYDGKVSAVSNVCQHQNGPLGEGRIVDGCITCPWHGYQYLPGSGASPPPFTEKIPTFDVRVRSGRVFVHPQPHPAGTAVPPAEWSES